VPAPKVASSTAAIAFDNFQPGIADLPGINYKPETATRDNTWRCIANHSGALTPLPRRTIPFDVGDHPDNTACTGLYVPPIGLLPKVNTIDFVNGQYPEHELFVGFEAFSAGTITQSVARYRRYEAPLGQGHDLVKEVTGPAPVWQEEFGWHPTGMVFATTRSNRADYSQPGVPVVIILGAGGLYEFPDDQAPSTTTPFTIFTSPWVLNMTTHQGRVLLELMTVYDHGVDTITFMGENMTWSWFNDVTPAHWGTWNGGDPTVPANFDGTAKVWSPENPSGFGALASMSANEIFAVKHSHGGLYVSGSLDTGTVVALPMVTGTDISHTPAVTPIGVAYGNRTSGVWVWSHGDASTLISPQMIPDFWVTTPGGDFDEFGGVSYQFATCADWLFVPNNFLYDTTLKSWWRYEDPAVAVYRWVTSQWHFIYAAKSFITAADHQPIAEYKREELTDSFSWQSHPIWQSVADMIAVTETELIAEGQGDITLTLTALNGDTNSITITLEDCGFPERFRERLSIQGKYVQLRIESKSPSTAVPAPTVYSVTLYPFSEAPVGRTR